MRWVNGWTSGSLMSPWEYVFRHERVRGDGVVLYCIVRLLPLSTGSLFERMARKIGCTVTLLTDGDEVEPALIRSRQFGPSVSFAAMR